MAERRRTLSAAVATLSLALVFGACSGDEEAGTIKGAQQVRADWAVSDTALTDTSGEEFTLAEDAGKPITLVFFGYTNCPDICPMVLANLASALTRLDDSQRERVEVVVVTTDPARDTEKVLRDYLDRYDPGFVGLTGDMDRILELGAAFHIPIEEGEKLPSGGYDVAHGDQVFLLEDDGSIPMYWSRDTSPSTFAHDLTTLLKEDA